MASDATAEVNYSDERRKGPPQDKKGKECIVTVEILPGRCNEVMVEIHLDGSMSGIAMAGLLSITAVSRWIGG